MRLSSFNVLFVVLGLAVFVAGGLWVWFDGGLTPTRAKNESTVSEVGENPGGPTPPKPAPAVQTRIRQGSKRNTPPASENPVPAVPPETVPEAPDNSAEWEEKIDSILTADVDEAQKAQRLLELIPTLPEPAQIEAAQHLVNLVPDEGYAATSPYLTNAHTAEPVLDILIGDLMNRPNTLKLPLLLQVARVSDHPKAIEAKDLLEFYVGEDLGADWGAWEKSVTTWLKENPE